jgi:hypothetical protein
MSYKQLNRDFATTFPCAELRYGRIAGSYIKRDIERSIKEAEHLCLQVPEGGEKPRYADVVAVISERRIRAATHTGVRMSTTNLMGIRLSGRDYNVAILRFAEKPGFGWAWFCPLKVDHDLDLHWKGLIQRDRWQTFIKRLNSVCAEASIFAHAFRHGA